MIKVCNCFCFVCRGVRGSRDFSNNALIVNCTAKPTQDLDFTEPSVEWRTFLPLAKVSGVVLLFIIVLQPDFFHGSRMFKDGYCNPSHLDLSNLAFLISSFIVLICEFGLNFPLVLSLFFKKKFSANCCARRSSGNIFVSTN